MANQTLPATGGHMITPLGGEYPERVITSLPDNLCWEPMSPRTVPDSRCQT